MRHVALLLHDVYRTSPRESGFTGAVADRYKLPLHRFEAVLAALVRVRARAGATRMPALTFDDGGVSYHTEVAPRLEALGWRGHCFVSTGSLGRRGFLDRAMLRDLHARGHRIGSHTVSHPERLSACGHARIVEEWRASRHALEDVLGRAVETASVPGGAYSGAVARAAAEAGVRLLFTSEPSVRLWMVGECVVAGRFALRRDDPVPRAAALAAARPAARARHWVLWNGKKVVRPLLGGAYRRLGAWVAARTAAD